MNNENFIKAQFAAFCKAINKTETPLKQKHVRVLILGTYKQNSASIFWHFAMRFQLEKNPVLTWKFCHILHKLIRDGHRQVINDSLPFCDRLTQLGNFWQHLRSSGYGEANNSYCKMLVSRLNFHKKYPNIIGSLSISSNQLDELTLDVNQTYELAIDMLDQMDELLAFKTTVMKIMDTFRWNSLIPQGQCLLAPLILVILDTSKLYDILVKTLFKLHSKISSDTLNGHRERFYSNFHKTKKFYEEVSILQYFKYLVSIPTIPTTAPNFLLASDLNLYQTPEAYLHVEANENGEVTPPDSQSICEDIIIGLTSSDSLQLLNNSNLQLTSSNKDERDEIIKSLNDDIIAERQSKERLVSEIKVRIEQYENRLIQMKNEINKYKLESEKANNELKQIKEQLNDCNEKDNIIEELKQKLNNCNKTDNIVDELKQKLTEKDQKFNKFKNIYDNLRKEHIDVLTQVKNHKNEIENRDANLKTKEDELLILNKHLEKLKTDYNIIQENALKNSEFLSNTQNLIDELEIKNQNLTNEINAVKTTHLNESLTIQANAKQNFENAQFHAFNGVCIAALLILEQAQEDLTSATSITYPMHLAANALHLTYNYLNEKLIYELQNTNSENFSNGKLTECCIYFAHRISQVIVNCVAAAYTTSIQLFELINEKCRRVLSSTISVYENLKTTIDWTALYDNNSITLLKEELESLENEIKILPSISIDKDIESIEVQLQDEMKQMDISIQNAVKQIESLQIKSKENSSGIRLEVNDKILDSCTLLMEAVRRLVKCSQAVQKEIQKDSISPLEFYKRNHLWTEGLLSAAKAIGASATVLVNAADGVITGTLKFEYLIVAAQEIAANVAQLYVSSRVKADKNSISLIELGSASKYVNSCTVAVVATVKSGQQSLADESLLDFTKYSLHEAKKEEMECQVRLIELESELTNQREKLATLRKQNYHL